MIAPIRCSRSTRACAVEREMWQRSARSENDTRPSSTRALRTARSTSSICRPAAATVAVRSTDCSDSEPISINRTEFREVLDHSVDETENSLVTTSDTGARLVELADDHPGVSDPG